MISLVLAPLVALAAEREPKVLLIGVDGLRAEVLEESPGKPATPAIDSLIADGCFTLDASASAFTVSGPGWSTVLCGVWPDKHRSVDNRFLITDYERFPSLFTLAKRARPDIRTAYFGNWGPIGERILAKDPIDVRVSLANTKDDAPHTDACVERIRSDAELDLAFFYLGEVDEVGHASGFHRDSAAYLAAIEAADARIGRVLDAIRQRPAFGREDWLVILTTDHGGTIDLNHGRDIAEHRVIPFIVSGDRAARGTIRRTVNQTDAVATAFTHLGLAVDPAWDLDSVPVGLAAVEPLFGRNLVVNGDAELASPAASPEGDRGIAGWRDWGGVSTLGYAQQKDFPTFDSPGPAPRGRSFFFGGGQGESRLVQRIDLAGAAREIDAWAVPFEFSAWLGGFGAQRDVAWCELAWLDERGGEIGRERLAAVSAEERAATIGGDAPTGLLARRAGGSVPPGARVAEVTLRFERSEGICDGYADSVSLVLRPEGAERDCGPAVFAHGNGGATVWMRAAVSPETSAEGSLLRCTLRGPGGDPREVDARPDPERDATVRFDFDALEPGDAYRYSICRHADGVELARGGFVTMDPSGRRARIAFGSCADIDESTARCWRRIALESPDAVVLLGDTPYIDTTELLTQRRRHRMFASVDAFERLTAAVPLFGTWDDHDIGRNDTDGRLPQKEQSRRAFLEYRPIADAGEGGEGIHHSFRSGPIEVFVLDTRWFARTEPSRGDPAKPTLLGEAQWRWLERGLRSSTAPFKVVASSMVWNSRVRPLKTDCWGAYPHEFERFQDLVREARAQGVVLVSGDVHRSRVVVHPTAARAGYDLVELVTSPLHARVHADAAVTGPDVVFDSGTPNAFLLLEARAGIGGDALVARFVSASGAVFHERTITPRLPSPEAR